MKRILYLILMLVLGGHVHAQAAGSPTISTAPDIAQVAAPGQTASFTVAVQGTAPFTYQWQKGGVNIAGATAAQYVIANLQVADTGIYTVIVTNQWGAAQSNHASLAVGASPTNPAVSLTLTSTAASAAAITPK